MVIIVVSEDAATSSEARKYTIYNIPKIGLVIAVYQATVIPEGRGPPPALILTYNGRGRILVKIESGACVDMSGCLNLFPICWI